MDDFKRISGRLEVVDSNADNTSVPDESAVKLDDVFENPNFIKRAQPSRRYKPNRTSIVAELVFLFGSLDIF
jgi:hypothetical protein